MAKEHKKSYLEYLNSYNSAYELLDDGCIRISDSCTEILIGLDTCMDVKIQKKNPVWKEEIEEETHIGTISFSQTEEGILSHRTEVNLTKVPAADTAGLVERTIAFIEETFMLFFSEWSPVK